MQQARPQNPERWREIENLYHEVLRRDPAARAAYLREACAGDADLCREVEELLAYQPRADGFLELPAADMLARRDTAALATAPEFRLDAGTRLGPYEILQPLGAGGMGEVYRGRDTRLGRVVALKVLASGSLEQAGPRLQREARAISSLNHPYICALYDIGREGDLDYLVMEYVEGPTLAARLEEGPLPLGDLLRIAKEIAEALECAHRQGIVHRDLKPGNIMLAARGAKLVDFGLARWPEQAAAAGANSFPSHTASLTMTGVLLGTPQYMAPEHIQGGPMDARTDIFAFGAVLFEMAYGRKAFAGDSSAEVMESIRAGDVQPVLRRESAAPAALDRVIRKCLEKAPEERYQSAAEVLRELQRVERRPRFRARLVWMAALAAGLILAIGAVALFRSPRPTPPLAAQILYSFKGKDGDGARCWRSGVTMDSSGALYGFTFDGGIGEHGIAYKIIPPAAGDPRTAWREEVLYRFHGADGAKPLGAPVFASDGSLYGGTEYGGRENHGVIFRLRPSTRPGGVWTETVIHHFTPASGDGGAPVGAPLIGSDGGLYGVTGDGGLHGSGIVYELLPAASFEGERQEKMLYSLTGKNGEANPWGNIIFGQDGGLYGTAGSRPGAVFQVRPPSKPGGPWEGQFLHEFPFASSEGETPLGQLAAGKHGELYGTAQWGGLAANGVIFELAPLSGPSGEWTYKVLHKFMSHAADGSQPTSGILIGPRGELYTVAEKGGTWGRGVIVKLTPATRAGDPWRETILYSFTGQGGDGYSPVSSPHLIFGKDGALYGTTVYGGAYDQGTVFRLPLPRD